MKTAATVNKNRSRRSLSKTDRFTLATFVGKRAAATIFINRSRRLNAFNLLALQLFNNRSH